MAAEMDDSVEVMEQKHEMFGVRTGRSSHDNGQDGRIQDNTRHPPAEHSFQDQYIVEEHEDEEETKGTGTVSRHNEFIDDEDLVGASQS